MDKEDVENIRRWRRRGYYSERMLVKKLEGYGYNALRIPLSNPSMNPIGDVIARRGIHSYCFEVKNGDYAVTIPRGQILKLFRFLEEFIVSAREQKHAILVAHLKKLWKFREVSWKDYDNDNIPNHITISRDSRSTWNIKKGVGRFPNT